MLLPKAVILTRLSSSLGRIFATMQPFGVPTFRFLTPYPHPVSKPCPQLTGLIKMGFDAITLRSVMVPISDE